MLKKIQNPRINYISRLIVLPLIAITVLAFTLRTKKEALPLVQLDKMITVVIDAGHGKGEPAKYRQLPATLMKQLNKPG